MKQYVDTQPAAQGITYDHSRHTQSRVFFRIHPAVYGCLGRYCDPAVSSQLTSYKKVHFVIVDRPLDCITKSMGVYIGSEALVWYLMQMDATGVQFGEIELTLSKDYWDHNQSAADVWIPKFYWLKVTGSAGVDDFGLSENLSNALVVSERVLEAMHDIGLTECDYCVYSTQSIAQAYTRCVIDMSGFLFD